jgi:hypothetical protein
MTTSTRRARRRPGGGAGSHTLARLAAAREQLDADIVAQRRHEDELLAEYAAVADAVAAVAARRDAALADLDPRHRARPQQRLPQRPNRQDASGRRWRTRGRSPR